MKRIYDYVTDDEQIAVVKNKRNDEGKSDSDGHTAYLTIYSSKARSNKIYVALNEGDTSQLEDFIQILQQVLKEVKSEYKQQA